MPAAAPLHVQFDVVRRAGGRGVPFHVGQFVAADGQPVVLPRVEVVELVDPVQHVPYQLLQEEARCHPHLAAERTADRMGEFGDIGVIDDGHDAFGAEAPAAYRSRMVTPRFTSES